MRHRSSPDYYVGALAVLALSCLAAGAALTDAVAPVDLPDVASIFDNQAVPVVQTMVEVPGLSHSDLSLTPVFSTPELRVVRAMATAAAPISSRRVRVRWVEPAVTHRPLPVTNAALALPVPAVELAALPVVDDEPRSWQPLPASTLAFDRSEDGLFSEMLRRTSSSFGKAGSTVVGAGSSMVGAFRSLSTAVKRVF